MEIILFLMCAIWNGKILISIFVILRVSIAFVSVRHVLFRRFMNIQVHSFTVGHFLMKTRSNPEESQICYLIIVKV